MCNAEDNKNISRSAFDKYGKLHMKISLLFVELMLIKNQGTDTSNKFSER